MLESLYILAITVESMTGAIAAGRKEMDPFGVLVISCCTAVGGGSIRDVLLGNYPLVWIANPQFILVVCTAALLTILLRPRLSDMSTAFLVLDALGLVTFSIIGAQKTLALGHSPLIASMMAIFTGAFGGVIRDILCNDVPLIFRRELYGSISFAAAWLYMGLCWLLADMTTAILVTLITGFLLRLAAIAFDIEMPVFRYRESRYRDDDDS
ncbi:trimeric intracellular cation channel family protein [Endozoicomonadaceae bacterium StTr2]